MLRVSHGVLAVAVLLAAFPLEAKTYTATDSNFKSIFSTVVGGDVIRLSGVFDGAALQNRTFAVPLTIDARRATFTDTLSLSNVGGINIKGGKYGNAVQAIGTAVRVSKANRINFSAPVVVGDLGRQHGISVSLSSNISIDKGSFTGLRLGVGFTSVTKGRITNSVVKNSTSDGFNVADSHNILVSRNACSGTSITPGAHPDCVQLWSISGRPRQSDIEISDNTAIGATQGFTSFNGDAGGGLRIKMLRNRVDTSYPQGIACYNCENSVFTDNVLTTQLGARWRTSMNIVDGRNNIVANNSVGALPKNSLMDFDDNMFADADFNDLIFDTAVLDKASFSDVEGLGGELGSAFNPDSPQGLALPDAVAGVPEPGTWALLLLGFGAVGMMARRRGAVAA